MIFLKGSTQWNKVLIWIIVQVLLLKPCEEKAKNCYGIPLSVISIRLESNCLPPCTFGDPFVNFYQINVKGEKNPGWRVGIPIGKHLLVLCFVLLVYKKIDRYVMSCLVFWSYWRMQIRVRGWYRVDFQRSFCKTIISVYW